MRRHRKPKTVTVTSSSSAPIEGGNSITHTSNAPSSATDGLISQLLDHVHQGRIFDARSIVTKLYAAENEDPTHCASRNLDSIRHIMEEVVTQSQHVESLLSELHSDDNWTLAKHKSGVTVHFRREPNSSIHTVRAATTFDNFTPKDFVRFCSLFVETELMHLWFPGHFMQPANLLSWHSKYSKVIHLRISLGIPMMSSRDTVVLGNGYHLPDRNAFLISTKTIIEDTCRYCDIPKPDKGVVRMATESIFYVQLVKSDAISFKMIGRDDLKLKYMPTALLNYISQGHLPFELMKTIHRTIRNFEGTMWEEKIEERGAYYTEIESKVYEQLEKWEKDGTKNIDPDDMYIADNRIKNAHVKLDIPTPQGKYYTDSDILNNICVLGEKCFMGSAMMAIVSVLFDFLQSPELKLLRHHALTAMELVCNENKYWSLIALALLLLGLVIVFSYRGMRESKVHMITDQPLSFDADDIAMEDTKVNNRNKSHTVAEFREESTVTFSPQSPPDDALQESPMQTPRPSQQHIGKIRSKLRTGLKEMKKVVPLNRKRKIQQRKVDAAI